MKKIKKLRLINWHSFSNDELEFGNINVITGENGTGKSTILDAIHFLQSGGDCKFNRAANTLGSGRSVENYLKARIGGENKEFLRPETNIIGHIAIEYFDDSTRKPFVLGAVLQLVEGTLEPPTFYQIKGDTYFKEMFINENSEISAYDELEKIAKTRGLDILRLGSRRESKKNIKRNVYNALGVPDKYEVLFSKAMGFEPLQEISRFATDFLLNEEELKLDSIQESMAAYRDIQQTVQIEKEKAFDLEPIYKSSDKYEESLKKEFAFDILSLIGKIEANEKSIEQGNRNLKVIDEKYKEVESREIYEDERARKLETQIQEIENSETYKTLKKLEAEKKQYSLEYEDKRNNVSNWEKRLETESIVAKKIGTSLDFSNIIQRNDYPGYQLILENYKSRVETIAKKSQNDHSLYLSNLNNLTSDRERIFNEVQQLRANNYAYPKYVDDLIKDIKDKINKTYGHNEVVITPLCSLCEINDQNYRDVIEGILDNRRFDLFISSKYYTIAKKIFDSKKYPKDYFGVGIIDTSKIDENEIINQVTNSLATKVDCFINGNDGKKFISKEPRKYIDFLLGDIEIVESIEMFKEKKRYITTNGAYFDGASIRFISKEAFKKPYIGQSSIKIRLEKAEKDLEYIDNEIKDVSKSIEQIKSILDACRRSRVDDLLVEKNHWQELKLVEEKLKNINHQIDLIKNSNEDYFTLAVTIEELTKEKTLALQNAKKYSDEMRQLDTSKGEINNKIENSKKIIENSIIEKNQKIEDNKLEFLDFEEYLSNLRESKSADELRIFAENQRKNASISKEQIGNYILSAMTKYNSKHPGEMIAAKENYKEYVKKYNKIITDDLAKLQPELEDSYKRAFDELREHFIMSIRRNLESSKADIESLNRTLRKHPFGNDHEVFKFSATKSNDKLLGEVYHIAMETNQDLAINNLLTEDLDPKSKDVIDEIFKILTSSEDDPKFIEKRREITDYRNYFKYEIIIDINKGENILYYSKNSNSKSGGETQTPFYALIAGAFQSILSKNERDGRSPTCVVVFDEAFNNMDGERIKQMLEFYKELNIQLIISVPSSRFSYISPYADGIISLAKAGDEVGIYQSFKK